MIFPTGCAKIFGPDFGGQIFQANSKNVRPVARPVSGGTAVPKDARSIEEFDTTSAQERADALMQSVSAAQQIGHTIASLGDPTLPGFWLRTPLVSTPIKGRVVFAKTGNSVAVDLIPIDGPPTGGSRISLPALRLLGASLTSLPELIVYAG